MGDRELYVEEEEAAAAERGTNRTFIILVSALGGLLALGICAFVAWAFVLNPRMQAGREAQNQVVLATNTAIAETATAMVEVAAAETATAEAPTPTETIAPTDTPRPTWTIAPTATATPAEVAEVTVAPGEVAEATKTPPGPTPTRRPTATPRPAGEEGVPQTGIGTLGAGAVAVGLLVLLIVVRRMRRAV